MVKLLFLFMSLEQIMLHVIRISTDSLRSIRARPGLEEICRHQSPRQSI